MANIKAAFFFEMAKMNIRMAGNAAGQEFKQSIRPYASFQNQAAALYQPFLYLESCVENLARMAKGSISLIQALFDEPWIALPKVFAGIVIEAAALIVNAFNAIISCMSILTRGLACMFNLGYAPPPREAWHNEVNVVFAGANQFMEGMGVNLDGAFRNVLTRLIV